MEVGKRDGGSIIFDWFIFSDFFYIETLAFRMYVGYCACLRLAILQVLWLFSVPDHHRNLKNQVNEK